ncbi:MAG: hypothetical protein AB7V27_04025 [Candidatus Binatia bacterium]
MRTEKRSAFLSGLCGIAVALGMCASSATADVTTERGASLLAFPKVLANGDSDTIVQITNISNNMVHATCYYVNAATSPFTGLPLWQITDFTIWLTKQQPTQWQVSRGRNINPADACAMGSDGLFNSSSSCSNNGLDPGAIPPVPENFVGELKCVEVDVAGNPIGGNHLKGEATVISRDGDTAKYNAIGIQGTELAGETGNELLLNQPLDSDDVIGQYNACPNVLLLNHLAEGAPDPVLFSNGRAGTCDKNGAIPCNTDEGCFVGGTDWGPCEDEPQVKGLGGVIDLRSASLTDLTLIPCTQDFENGIPAAATVQFEIFNEFEERFSASTTIVCWRNFYLFQVDSPNDPDRSVFSFATLGTTAAFTRISPVNGGVLGVAGVTRADSSRNLARTLLNIHMEGDRFTGSGEAVVDKWTIPAFF